MVENIFEYIVDYCNGNISEADSRKLRTWIDASPENRDTFKKYIRLVKMHRMIKGSCSINDERAWMKLSSAMKARKIRRIRQRVVAVAAVVGLLFGVGAGFWIHKSEYVESDLITQILPGTTKATLILANGSQLDLTRNDLKEVQEQGALIKNDTLVGLQYELNRQKVEEPVWHTVKVPIAGEYSFTLSDGTHVWLNSDSEITFPVNFVGNRREVFISGEVYFDVTKDTERPFVVKTSKTNTVVLGTSFNVKAYKEENTEITLVSGSVVVVVGDEKCRIKPGQQVEVDNESLHMKTKDVDANVVAAWKDGLFDFDNITLDDLCVQLTRWYGVDFFFVNPAAAERRFTGAVKRSNDLKFMLDFIQKTSNIRFEVKGKTVSIFSN